MAYCHEAGLPHSEFLAWDPIDRAKTIAYSLEKAQRCGSCGTADWEWIADPQAYVAAARVCTGCMRRDALIEDLAPAAGGRTPPGRSVVLLPRVAHEAIQADPSAHQVDSPSMRRARKQEAEAESGG